MTLQIFFRKSNVTFGTEIRVPGAAVGTLLSWVTRSSDTVITGQAVVDSKASVVKCNIPSHLCNQLNFELDSDTAIYAATVEGAFVPYIPAEGHNTHCPSVNLMGRVSQISDVCVASTVPSQLIPRFASTLLSDALPQVYESTERGNTVTRIRVRVGGGQTNLTETRAGQKRQAVETVTDPKRTRVGIDNPTDTIIRAEIVNDQDDVEDDLPPHLFEAVEESEWF